MDFWCKLRSLFIRENQQPMKHNNFKIGDKVMILGPPKYLGSLEILNTEKWPKIGVVTKASGLVNVVSVPLGSAKLSVLYINQELLPHRNPPKICPVCGDQQEADSLTIQPHGNNNSILCYGSYIPIGTHDEEG
jgi:hypothetical protein